MSKVIEMMVQSDNRKRTARMFLTELVFFVPAGALAGAFGSVIFLLMDLVFFSPDMVELYTLYPPSFTRALWSGVGESLPGGAFLGVLQALMWHAWLKRSPRRTMLFWPLACCSCALLAILVLSFMKLFRWPAGVEEVETGIPALLLTAVTSAGFGSVMATSGLLLETFRRTQRNRGRQLVVPQKQ
jgi:hypothetical protein